MGWMAKARGCLGIIALACATQIHATVFEVTVNTLGLAGTDATLAFDLISGDVVPDSSSSVQISDFSTDGALTTSSGTSGVTGSLLDPAPATVTVVESDLLNEYLQGITLGTFFTFHFSTTGVGGGVTPDAFSFLVLDQAALSNLFLTDEPLGTNALVIYNIGDAAPQAFSVTTPEGVTVLISEATTSIPEPSVLVLALAGLFAMAFARVFKQ